MAFIAISNHKNGINLNMLLNEIQIKIYHQCSTLEKVCGDVLQTNIPVLKKIYQSSGTYTDQEILEQETIKFFDYIQPKLSGFISQWITAHTGTDIIDNKSVEDIYKVFFGALKRKIRQHYINDYLRSLDAKTKRAVLKDSILANLTYVKNEINTRERSIIRSFALSSKNQREVANKHKISEKKLCLLIKKAKPS